MLPPIIREYVPRCFEKLQLGYWYIFSQYSIVAFRNFPIQFICGSASSAIKFHFLFSQRTRSSMHDAEEAKDELLSDDTKRRSSGDVLRAKRRAQAEEELIKAVCVEKRRRSGNEHVDMEKAEVLE